MKQLFFFTIALHLTTLLLAKFFWNLFQLWYVGYTNWELSEAYGYEEKEEVRIDTQPVSNAVDFVATLATHRKETLLAENDTLENQGERKDK